MAAKSVFMSKSVAKTFILKRTETRL